MALATFQSLRRLLADPRVKLVGNTCEYIAKIEGQQIGLATSNETVID